jgi:conjugal transfer pilus assembly protein TraI
MTCWPQSLAEKALAGLGFGDAMAMLKSTSDIAEEKPEQEDTESTELPKPDASKKGKQQSKPGKAKRRNPETLPEVKKICPSGHCQTHLRWQNDDPLQALKDVGGGLGDIDFPYSTHRQKQPALTQQTRNPRYNKSPKSKRNNQNRTSFHKNKTPER